MPAEFHPDSESLAALADRELPKRERDAVMSHVSHCQQCRACLFLIASTQPAPPGARALGYCGVAAVLCLFPLLLFFATRVKHGPRPERTTAVTVIPTTLLHVSLAKLPSSFVRRSPRERAAAYAFPLASPIRIVVQTERGERWLALVIPWLPAKRN